MKVVSVRYWICLALINATFPANLGYCQGDRSRFATEDSRSDYVHRIELYDARNTVIQPGSSRPYSPSRTCGRCHDVALISRGFHFSVDASVQNHGRPGEPWIWVDPTTGTQLPLSYRKWKNSYTPEELEISHWDFALRFGRRSPGGFVGGATLDEPAEESTTSGQKVSDRFHLSGPLEVDCMICHARDSTFDLETWTKQIDEQNFSWASTVAIGLATVKGAVRRLPDDFDVASAEGEAKGRYPQISYEPGRFGADGMVFLDIVRSPSDNACYRCHSTMQVGENSPPLWTHQGDVHERAGLRCVDCHPNALGHEIVRGFEGEVHPQQDFAASLSCRGCHIGPTADNAPAEFSAGRLGAPYPAHRGLPPIHLDRLSCTACHSGTLPQNTTHLVHTSRNHLLGQKAHRHENQQPEIVETVLMPREGGKLYPHRVVWPSYWGSMDQAGVTPLKPSDVQQTLKPVLRARKDFLTELTRVPLSTHLKAKLLGEERASVPINDLTEKEQALLAELQESEGRRALHKKLRDALVKLQQSLNIANPVYVAGERLYRLDDDSQLQVVDNPNPRPYAWPVGHDVRPARWSLGANGCTDCHTNDSPFLDASVTAEAPVPAEDLTERSMHEFAEVDNSLWYVWHESLRAKPLLLVVLAGSSVLLGCLIVGRSATAAGLVPLTEGQPHKDGIAVPWSFAERLVYGGFITTVALLGFTSLTPVLRSGSMHGWWLIAHMVVAGPYVAFVVLMALFASHRFQARAIRRLSADSTLLLVTTTYWLMMGLSLVIIVTALLQMLPYLGTREIARAITVHRYCGLALLPIALIHPLLLKACNRRKA